MFRMARTRSASTLRSVVITALLAASVTLIAPGAVATAETPDLLMSEYIEGSSFNKAIEIYNGTGGEVDLAAGLYTSQLYSNGSSTVSQTRGVDGHGCRRRCVGAGERQAVMRRFWLTPTSSPSGDQLQR